MQLIYGVMFAVAVLAIGLLCKVLPTSPFAAYLSASAFNDYLPYINYFIPIDTFIVIGESWLVALVVWYLVKIAIKAVSTVSDISPLH